MYKRAAVLVAGLATMTVVLGACGDSVRAGGENASTNPASGIWVSPTVGAENISGHLGPPVPPQQPLPSSTPPVPVPAGQKSTVANVELVVHGGCWQDGNVGNLYGAYDQQFWWQGDCADTTAQVTIEQYPSVAAATAKAHHPSAAALLDRYQDGAVLVDVYANAPAPVLTELGNVKGLVAVPGYGG
jgi:hypothetical protein